MTGRALALLLMATGLPFVPWAASAQQGERRCYFGECPDDQSPQPAPPSNLPQVPQSPPPQQPTGPSTADELPHYCCTIAGVLGPYPNPGPYGAAAVGTACFGMAADGLMYDGAACYGNEQPTTAAMPVPSYCCTLAGRFGPFPNPGWPEGSACWSDTLFGPMEGLACY